MDVKGKLQFDAVQRTKFELCGGKTGGREGIGWPSVRERGVVTTVLIPLLRAGAPSSPDR